MEEFYARDLPSYYDALGTHPHHNYYEGRDKAPVTTWLGYFVQRMEDIFSQVSRVVTDLQTEENLTEDSLLRELDHCAWGSWLCLLGRRPSGLRMWLESWVYPNAKLVNC